MSVISASFAASITSLSLIEPPGEMAAFIPWSFKSSTVSAKKKPSDAKTTPSKLLVL